MSNHEKTDALKKGLFLAMYTLLQWTFGIVQNITGLIILAYLHAVRKDTKTAYFHGALVTNWKKPESLGMGMFIFLGSGCSERSPLAVHEYGHTVQSAILGPLYLPVIGLPSAIWCGSRRLRRMRSEKGVSYFCLYCERWANSLGRRVLRREPPER